LGPGSIHLEFLLSYWYLGSADDLFQFNLPTDGDDDDDDEDDEE